MEQAVGFLEKGAKVRLLVNHPARQREAAVAFAKAIANHVRGRALVSDAPGASRGPKNALLLDMNPVVETNE